ncbi:MAG: hypothetical protein IKT40_08995 [Bacilli bacterium]|nr:hypothetical protein [Bacilli bacterium]
MGKFFSTSEDLLAKVNEKFHETGLESYGVTLKVMSVKKAKDVIKVSKVNETAQFILKKDSMIQMCIYEAVLERIDEDAIDMLIEMALSNVSYDIDKDKLVVDGNPYNQLFRMRKKYGDMVLNTLELTSIIMLEIEEEERERKQAEKEAKKAKKNNNVE